MVHNELKGGRLVRGFVCPCLIILLCAFGAGVCHALEPDEILVIVNSRSSDSVRIADYYQKKRKIPKENVISISCSTHEAISRGEYDTCIAGPVRRALLMPGWAVRIRCLLVTCGVPLRIKPDSMNHDEALAARKIKERLKTLKDLIDEPRVNTTRKKAYRKEQQQLGRKLSVINHKADIASVDSELSLVKRAGSYNLDWWIPNPLYIPWAGKHREKGIRASDVLMVSRLDGPDLETVFRMVDDSISAEINGLNGTAYFDCRYREIPGGRLSAYYLYDKWLREAAKITRQNGIKTELDTRPELFPPGSCPDASLYCGWYSLSRYVAAFSWRPGAVAYHIASGECTSLHDGGRQWCPMLLKDGVSVTLGPVAEPYLRAFPPPHLFFRLILDKNLTIAESYMLTCPYLSWRMVLLADPLYRPGLALARAKR